MFIFSATFEVEKMNMGDRPVAAIYLTNPVEVLSWA